jgi:hypothetical protein
VSVHTVVPVLQVEQSVEVPMLDNPRERASARFQEVIGIARTLVEADRAWARLGRIASAMERDGDFKTLGYPSIGAMFVEVENLTGYSRSSIYAYKKLYESVSANGGNDVMDMSLGSANVYAQLPAPLQRDPEVRESAKSMKPQDFEKKIEQAYPDAHIESKQLFKLRMVQSQSTAFRAALDMWRLLNDDLSSRVEEALEGVCADFCLTHQQEYRSKLASLGRS